MAWERPFGSAFLSLGQLEGGTGSPVGSFTRVCQLMLTVAWNLSWGSCPRHLHRDFPCVLFLVVLQCGIWVPRVSILRVDHAEVVLLF